MASERGVERLYRIAKDAAVDSLGGQRAYAIAGPSVRRMAIAAAILDLVVSQDSSIADATVRRLAESLHLLLASSSDRDFL